MVGFLAVEEIWICNLIHHGLEAVFLLSQFASLGGFVLPLILANLTTLIAGGLRRLLVSK